MAAAALPSPADARPVHRLRADVVHPAPLHADGISRTGGQYHVAMWPPATASWPVNPIFNPCALGRHTRPRVGWPDRTKRVGADVRASLHEPHRLNLRPRLEP